MSKTKRKSGYYWVQNKNNTWLIAKWFSSLNMWEYVKDEMGRFYGRSALDKDWKQIDERKIER